MSIVKLFTHMPFLTGFRLPRTHRRSLSALFSILAALSLALSALPPGGGAPTAQAEGFPQASGAEPYRTRITGGSRPGTRMTAPGALAWILASRLQARVLLNLGLMSLLSTASIYPWC